MRHFLKGWMVMIATLPLWFLLTLIGNFDPTDQAVKYGLFCFLGGLIWGFYEMVERGK